MTMLPDVPIEEWDQYQSDVFRNDTDQRIASLPLHVAPIRDDWMQPGAFQPPTPSDSLTNPLGTAQAAGDTTLPVSPENQSLGAQVRAPLVAAPSGFQAPSDASADETILPNTENQSLQAQARIANQNAGFGLDYSGTLGADNSVGARNIVAVSDSGAGGSSLPAPDAPLPTDFGTHADTRIASLAAPPPSASASSPPAGQATSSTVNGVSGPPDLVAAAMNAADAQGVDPNLYVSLIQQESSFNPRAGSGAGAQGLAQLMPATARGLGVTDPFDPIQSLQGGARYLKQQLDTFGGDVVKALAAYNAGPGAVQKYGGIPPYEETQRYVKQVMGRLSDEPIDTSQITGQAGTYAPGPAEGLTRVGSSLETQQASGYTFPVANYSGDVALHWGDVPGGSDLFAPRGTPVVAMRGGKVLEAGYNSIGGNSVLIQGDDGNQYYYAHFDKAPSVKSGQPVTAGTYLGPVGNTGDAANTGTHLHIGIGPSILLGADKYGGTGGKFDAVGLLRSALADQRTPQTAGAAAGPAAIAPALPAAPAQDTSPVDWLARQKDSLAAGIGGAASSLGQTVSSAASSLFGPQPAGQPAASQPMPSDALTNPLGTGNAPQPPASSMAPPQPQQSVWDRVGQGISDVFKSAFGANQTMAPEGGGYGAVPPGGQNPLPAIGQAVGDVVNQATQAIPGILYGPTGRPPTAEEFAARAAANPMARVRYPDNPLEVLGGASLGVPTSGEEAAAARNEAIARGNPLRDVPVVGGATTFAAQAALDPTNLLLAGPGIGKAGVEAGAALASNPEVQAALRSRQLAQGPGLDAITPREANFLRSEVLAATDDPRPAGLGNPGLPNIKSVIQQNLAEVVPQDTTLYHETSVPNARAILQRAEAGPRNQNIWVSDNRDLALGQGGKGIMLEFDPALVNGGAGENPTKAFSAQAGMGTEYQIDKSLRGAVTAIVANNQRQLDQLAKDPLIASRFDFSAAQQTAEGIRVPRALPFGSARDILTVRQPAQAQVGFAMGMPATGPKPPAYQSVMPAGAFETPTPPTTGTTPGAAIDDVRTRIVRGFFDRQVDINQAQQRYAKSLGRPLNADEMAAELQRLSADPAAAVKIDEGLKPAIQAVGDDYAALRDYVTLRSNVQVADALGNDARLFSGGMTKADSQVALANLQAQLGPDRFQTVQQAADQVSQFSGGLRQRLVDSGVLSQDQANAMEAKYPDWVKTRILDYMKDPAGGQGAGTKIGLSSRDVQAYTQAGTARAREDPLASTVAYTHQVERMANKNEAFNAMLKIDQASPKPMLRQVPQDFSPTKNQVTMVGFQNGQKVKYVTDNRALGEAINGAGVMSVPEWTSAWQKVFRSLATSRNPVFLAGNAALDIPTYAFRTAIRDGGPQALPGIMVDLAKGYGDAFQGLLQGEFRGASTSAFLKGGGGQSGYFTGGEGQSGQAIADLRRSNVFQIDGKADLLRLAKDLITLKPVESLGERIELGPRVAAYNRALARGANPVQAVIDGRTVTVDFSQGGTVTKYLNNFVPFLNVGFQGPVQIARAFRDNPRAFVATTGSLIGLPTVAAEVWNRADPQRAKDYADVPEYVKNQGVVVMLPGEAPTDAQGNRKPLYAVLKLREWAPFAAIAREATARALGDNSKSLAEMAQSIGTGFSPTQSSSAGQLANEALSGIPVVPAAAQLGVNKDLFRNRDIVTQRNDQNASAAAKAITPAIQAVLDRAGVNAEVRPSAVEFFIRNQGAGVGGAALGASDIAAGTARQNTSPTSLPGVGGLVGRFVSDQTGQGLQTARGEVLTQSARDILRQNGITSTPGAVGSSANGVPLRLEEETRYQQLANRYVDEAIHRAPANPNWTRMPQSGKQALVDELTSAAKERAAQEVLRSIGGPSEARRRVAVGSSR